MSFVDLATLAMHRRYELEARINILMKKCDEAQINLRNLKLQGQGMVAQLNCEPTELKDRFLNCMKHLDEYIYMVTDFNLSVGAIVETASHDHYPSPTLSLDVTSNLSKTPVPDLSKYLTLPPKIEKNLLDVLSEPNRAISTVCANQCPVEKRKIKKPKENVLIDFSSGSSQESVPCIKVEKETQCEAPVAELKSVSLNDSQNPSLEQWNLPAQAVLQVGVIYTGSIMHVDETSLWIITESINEAQNLMLEMRQHYLENPSPVSREQATSLTYCAYYDDDSDCSYRCLVLNLEDDDVVDLFLVDTGEARLAPLTVIQPLARQFCKLPPFARCCYLAGVEPVCTDDKNFLARQEAFYKKFVGQQCGIEIDDNTSESLGVYISLPSKQLLNHLVVAEGYAVPIEIPKNLPKAKPPKKEKQQKEPTKLKTRCGPPEILNDADFSIDDCLEFEDPVEAVTGYHNRDEADICKHYKGGAKKTCFKGAKCKKKHIMKHPDGWTLDKVEVSGKGRKLPLPPPGSWHRVRVTCVAHFNHVYVQLVNNQNNNAEETKRNFGVVMPPATLPSLVLDMNSPAARIAMKPLKIAPAPGELVAALYPPDDQWYRARVISHTNHDQSVEVRYVDYGTELWVKENNIKHLEACYTVLPFQAIRCRLAGVKQRGQDAAVWAEAKAALLRMVQDRTVECHVIARNYDELEIELFDADGNNIAEKLTELGLVLLTEYSIQDDSNCTQKIVVP